jgi:CheY-like chemotaxis protein
MSSENNTRSKNILVADANADYRSLLRCYLERLRYPAPGEARDGEEALYLASTQPFRLIIMEIALPKLDGFEVVRRLRENPRPRHAWTVAATAMALPGDREKCLAGGFDSYLAKPFTLEEFARMLHAVFPA